MAKNVTVLNTATNRVGTIPERLFLSDAFNKDGVLELYDGPVDPDCGCPSLKEKPVVDEDGEPTTDNEKEDEE